MCNSENTVMLCVGTLSCCILTWSAGVLLICCERSTDNFQCQVFFISFLYINSHRTAYCLLEVSVFIVYPTKQINFKCINVNLNISKCVTEYKLELLFIAWIYLFICLILWEK